MSLSTARLSGLGSVLEQPFGEYADLETTYTETTLEFNNTDGTGLVGSVHYRYHITRELDNSHF